MSGWEDTDESDFDAQPEEECKVCGGDLFDAVSGLCGDCADELEGMGASIEDSDLEA